MRPKYIHTECIVLKRVNYKDADKILTIYTEDIGKITCLAKGIRKINSRKKSHLELLNHSKIYLIESGNWYIVTQAESISTHSNIKKNLNNTQWAYYISEIFEKLVPEGEENKILFQFILKTLSLMDKSPNSNIPNLINAFNIKLLRILGFYNRSEILNLPSDMQKYINTLETLKYEELQKHDQNGTTKKNTHLFLREYTEEILERVIKTKTLFE